MSQNPEEHSSESGGPSKGGYQLGLLTTSGIHYRGHRYHDQLITIYLTNDLVACAPVKGRSMPEHALKCWFRAPGSKAGDDVPEEIFVWNPGLEQEMSLPLVENTQTQPLPNEDLSATFPTVELTVNQPDHSSECKQPYLKKTVAKNRTPSLRRKIKHDVVNSRLAENVSPIRVVEGNLSTRGVIINGDRFYDERKVSELLRDVEPARHSVGGHRVLIAFGVLPFVYENPGYLEKVDEVEERLPDELPLDPSRMWVLNESRNEWVELPNADIDCIPVEPEGFHRRQTFVPTVQMSPWFDQERARLSARTFLERVTPRLPDFGKPSAKIRSDRDPRAFDGDIGYPPVGKPAEMAAIEMVVRRLAEAPYVFLPQNGQLDIEFFLSQISEEAQLQLKRLRESKRSSSDRWGDDHG